MKNKLFIYAVFAAILFAACKNDPESENPPAPKTVHVQDISIKNPINPVSLVKGTTYQVEAAVLPKNADNKKSRIHQAIKHLSLSMQTDLFLLKTSGRQLLR